MCKRTVCTIAYGRRRRHPLPDMDLPCVFGAFARARRMVKQLKKPTGDGAASTAADPSATAKVAATSVLVKNVAKPAESPIRKKCYVIFEGTASQSLRAAFARRPDWRDGTAAHNDAVGEEARPPAPPPTCTTGWQRAAQNVRCHEAMQRASGRGGISFCWRHMPPKHPDTSSVVVNRWRAPAAGSNLRRPALAWPCEWCHPPTARHTAPRRRT